MDATTQGQSFADWLRLQMAAKGYAVDGPRAGGPSLLARQIGVHRATISRILKDGAIPKAATLRAIADQLHIPRSVMLDAAGVSDEERAGSGPEPPAEPDSSADANEDPEPDPAVLFDGGLRNDSEKAIWAITALPWQARQAAIEATRTEARRILAERTVDKTSTRRLA
ncbi:helix-turn-helix domain-containing protein [Actinomadura violacea]|uniref:Helix-turn-helix domain-containing protein n=1 Tax=Actinomadura violacea TaxID=2819934 RepID=A0ABS3S624_9ACTN|nr:helix-turn-helix transcriptional regulator [Actinomadura violacea]MBO2464461.1 helix-turn-helix domain-containing protein [Actinomadura violacea]